MSIRGAFGHRTLLFSKNKFAFSKYLKGHDVMILSQATSVLGSDRFRPSY